MNVVCEKIYAIFFLFLIAGVSACRDDSAGDLQPIVGNWSVTRAICDDVDQPVWTGKTISFKQVSADSGVYEFPTTPYDSIWSKSGSWKVVSDIFLRYDYYPPISGGYQVRDNTLTITILLVQNSPAKEYSGYSILPVAGNWRFTFKRN